MEKELGKMNHIQSLVELTRIGARMMLQVALEEELKAFLGRDYYESKGTHYGLVATKRTQMVWHCDDSRGKDNP